MYKSNYKKGSYGGLRNVQLTQNKRVAAQQAQRYAKTVAASRGGAPIANRGFGSMSITGNRERKFFDLTGATYGVSDTGSFTLLHIPILGSDFYNRIGRKTVIKSVYIRGQVLCRNAGIAPAIGTSSFTEPQLLRMIVFVDLQPNGAAPAITDLLVNAVVNAQLNPNNRDRFKVIKDKQYTMDALILANVGGVFSGAVNRTSHDIKCYKKLNIETIFNQTNGGTIGDINSGALYMFWMGSGTIPNTSIASVSTRVRFDDS